MIVTMRMRTLTLRAQTQVTSVELSGLATKNHQELEGKLDEVSGAQLALLAQLSSAHRELESLRTEQTRAFQEVVAIACFSV